LKRRTSRNPPRADAHVTRKAQNDTRDFALAEEPRTATERETSICEECREQAVDGPSEATLATLRTGTSGVRSACPHGIARRRVRKERTGEAADVGAALACLT